MPSKFKFFLHSQCILVALIIHNESTYFLKKLSYFHTPAFLRNICKAFKLRLYGKFVLRVSLRHSRIFPFNHSIFVQFVQKTKNKLQCSLFTFFKNKRFLDKIKQLDCLLHNFLRSNLLVKIRVHNSDRTSSHCVMVDAHFSSS